MARVFLSVYSQFPMAATQSNTNLVAENNRNLLSCSSEGLKSEISITVLKSKYLQVHVLPEALGNNLSLASFSFCRLPAFLGLWPYHSIPQRAASSNLSLPCLHITFSSVCIKSSSASLL